jgi:pantoate--beta-alanine ligase
MSARVVTRRSRRRSPGFRRFRPVTWMPLDLVETISALRTQVSATRRSGLIGFVPTMGALHTGHASLIERARSDCSTVVVSIFVNPLQFDRADDLERYPRSIEADVELCTKLGVDLVFVPNASEIYPAPPACTVEVRKLADHLCGRFRPGHFSGVATVVLKLLQMVQPNRAYFGEKDAQQLAVVRRLVTDFNVPVTIVGIPTVREPDGLAVSSRNQRLDETERRLAPALYRALRRAESQIAAGVADPGEITRDAQTQIPRDERLTLEYLELVDPGDFQPVSRITQPVIVAGALWVGNTRLIDNLRCVPPM